LRADGPDKSRLELRRRLGVKYLTPPGSVMKESPAPALQDKTPGPGPSPLPSVLPGRPAVPAGWVTAHPGSLKAMELTAFREDICTCQKCPLGASRKNFVFGSGDPEAQVMFIGEAPGADEDEKGLPFVGKAGQLLTKIIESTKTWKREEVFICNVLKCRPPGNRTPLPEEVDQCLPYLQEQIRVIGPKVILALGASAAQALLRTKESVGKLRGRWHDLDGTPLLVTYHPAALLRFDGYKKDVWEDMKVLTAKFVELTKG